MINNKVIHCKQQLKCDDIFLQSLYIKNMAFIGFMEKLCFVNHIIFKRLLFVILMTNEMYEYYLLRQISIV